jgi:hypothetical protein
MNVYDNESVLQQINATDSNIFGCFSINDSNFNINCSGYLQNSNYLSPGTYYLNITINDSANNKDSRIILINVTSSITIPQITIIQPVNGFSYSQNAVDFNIIVNQNTTCWFSLNNQPNITMNTTDNTNYSYSTNLVSGTYYITFFCNASTGLGTASSNFSIYAGKGGAGVEGWVIPCNLSIRLIPHYYFLGSEVFFYQGTLKYDGLRFDLKIHSRDNLENITLIDAKPNPFKNNINIIMSNISQGDYIIASTNIIPTKSYNGSVTFWAGIKGIANTGICFGEDNLTISFEKTSPLTLMDQIQNLGAKISPRNIMFGIYLLIVGILAIIILLFIILKRRKRDKNVKSQTNTNSY